MTSKPPIVLPDAPLTVAVQIKRETHFYDMILNYVDIFASAYVGYWAYGIRVSGGWLIYDFGDEEITKDGDTDAVVEEFTKSGNLPPRWHYLDVYTVDRIVTEGCKRYGFDFQNNYDAVTLDVAVQLALLGEIVYG